MTEYRVKRINLNGIKNIDDYNKAVFYAPIDYVKGLKALSEYCGGKLHRNRCGYSGINGDIEYVAERVN